MIIRAIYIYCLISAVLINDNPSIMIKIQNSDPEPFYRPYYKFQDSLCQSQFNHKKLKLLFT